MCFEQPYLEGGSLPIAGGLELDGIKGPFQPKPFYDSVITAAQDVRVAQVQVGLHQSSWQAAC